MIFLFKALSFRISATLLLHVLVHTTVSQREPVGPMSELTGTTAVVDKILSPMSPGQNATGFASFRNMNPGTLPGREKADVPATSCSVSFSESANTSQSRIPKQNLARRNLKSLREDERSALFLTEAAQKCVESTRNWGQTEGYPLGGYVDIEDSVVGTHVNVFRLGTVAKLNELSGTEVSELESDIRLQLSFSTQSSPLGPTQYSRTSPEGALRLSQPAWAPSDNPTHVINPTNPHFTASYGDTEMVLIGSFHLNLPENPPAQSSSRWNSDLSERLSESSPVGAELVGRHTENLKSHLINLTEQPVKRSHLIGSKPWGLFKRQNAAATSSGDFKPDPACSNATLNAKSFSAGKSIQTPSLEAIIPPSPFFSTDGEEVNPEFLPVILPFNHEQNAVLAASGRSNRLFTATFQLPGRSLMVFPIGLAIYASLSLITLGMVVLVTVERIQYRNQFRSRKKNEKSLPPDSKIGRPFMRSPV